MIGKDETFAVFEVTDGILTLLDVSDDHDAARASMKEFVDCDYNWLKKFIECNHLPEQRIDVCIEENGALVYKGDSQHMYVTIMQMPIFDAIVAYHKKSMISNLLSRKIDALKNGVRHVIEFGEVCRVNV